MKNYLLRTTMPTVSGMQQALCINAKLFCKTTILQLLVLFGLLGWSQQSLAQTVIAGYDVSGVVNNSTSTTLVSSTVAANSTAGLLTKSSGVTSSNLARGFGGSVWSQSTSPGSITGNSNLTFSVKATNPGSVLSLSAITPFTYRRSNTGPSAGLVQYQINSGAFITIAAPSFTSTNNNGATLGPILLSGIPALQNLPSTSTVTFRIIPYGATSTGGTFYIYDSPPGSSEPDLAVTGTITCPTITATLNGTTTICAGSSTNLTATITGGTGPYSLTVSNGTVNVPVNNYTSGTNISVSPTSDKTYTIVAATDANACPVTVTGSSAIVTVKQNPSVSNAGTSQTVTTGNAATLAANTPTTGTGMWSVASGPSMVASQFSSTTSPTATFTPAGGLGTYVLTWTISNAPCTPSANNVTITVAPPTCGTLTVPGNYATIQAAINAACPGALIQVTAGTYTEQITITKSLSIVGAGSGSTTIKAPATLTAGGPDEGAPYIKRNIVEIKGSSAVTLSGLNVNGPVTGQDGCGTDAFGIYVYDNSSLALSNAAITNAQLSDPSLFGCQVGFSLGVGLTGSPGSATLTNVTMSNYQKGGILARGAGTVLVADNITVTGIGATTATAQNGVQVSSGASATITHSSIANNAYITPTGSTFYTASGIITDNTGPVLIANTAFSGNDVGLDAGDGGVITLTSNTFTNNSYASVYPEPAAYSYQFTGTITGLGNTYDKQVTNNNKPGGVYSLIQVAIDDATAGDVLTAGTGTFAEDLTVDKALTIKGANFGIDPNTGNRVAETILVPATAGTDVFYLADGLTGVTIDGFTIDGNNPALTGTNINGSDVDASTGISSYSSVVSNVKINNNIIRNFADYGIVLDPSSSGGVPATGGHEITHNKIDNVGAGTGVGVLLQNNAYAAVTNNVISRVRVGVQTGNFYQAAPGGTAPSMSGNAVSGQRVGIFHNLQYQAATPFIVANNTLSVDATGASFGVTPRAGMVLISLGVPTTVNSNTVNGGFISGVEALNNVGNVTLVGGAVQGNTSGILLTNKDVVGNTASTGSKLLVSGVTVSNSPIGIKVFDDPTAPAGPNASITVTDNTQITGSGAFTAVAISGVDASATITGNASSFVGNGSGTGVDINGGSASVTADRITNFTTGISVSNGGQLTNAANNFVTGNGTGVAYAADASTTQGVVTNNDLSGNTSKAITNGLASTTIGATCNWYGTTNVDGQAGTLFTGAVTYSPYLNSGTDNDNNSNTGFQPTSNACVSNQPPTASIIANQTATVGLPYSFTVPAFTDPENQTLTYTASINPANGLTFDPTTRVISGTPTATGVSNVTVVATDPGSMSASQTFTITVNPVPCPQSVTNVTTGETFCTIQAAINAPSTVTGHTINVGAGTYNEQVLINKSVSIVGVGSPKPVINFTGTPGLASSRLTLFEVTAPNVTVANLKFTPDLTKVGSAILASVALPGSVSGLTVQNNDINPYRSGGLVSYNLRNAVSINYADFRVNGSNPSNLLMMGNTITYNDNGTAGNTLDDAGFRSGFATDEGGGSFTGNTIQTVNQDIQARFGSAGAINVTNNNINGGGVELAEYNAGAASVMVTGNNFNGAFGSTFTSSLRLKNNQQAIPTTVSGNNFTGHNLGISLENYQAVTVDNNMFTPATGSTTYQHITVNTKEFSSSSGMIPPAIALTLTNNTFNGSSSPTSGTALAFANQDNDNPTFGPFVLGTAGNENKFGAGLGTFIYLVNATGTVNPNATPAAPFAVNLNVVNDLFDVGSGLKLPQALTSGERATLETKLFHKPDAAALGLITYFYPVRNVTQSSSYSTIQSAIDAATANDVIELAEYTFNEHATVTKPLTITGVSQTGTIIDGTGLTAGNGFTLQDNVSGISIGNLTIRKQSGSANTTGNGIYGKTNNNLTITNVTSVSNTVHGIILETSGTLTNVSVTNSTLSSNGIGNSGRGFIIFNNLKQNITVANNLIQNNGLTGIDFNEGTATGITITGNTTTGNGDEGIGLLGALETGGANRIANNTITDNGHYGIEVKSSIGTGATSGPGSLVIENNVISRTADLPGSRDIAGISVTRRGAGVSVNTRETPQGAVVQNNTVTGYVNSGTGDGFGIVVEGINYQVTGNTASGNDVGLQEQQTSIGQRNRTNGTPSDGDSPYDVSTYFDRGNSIYSCGVVTGNTLTGNTLTTRAVGQNAAGRGLVTNTNTGATYCTIQAAVDAASAGNTLVVSAGTYPESVTVTKGLTINGAQVSVDPRTGRSGGESIVTVPLSDTANGNLFTVRADNVTIDGFTLDGDNPSLTGGLVVNGADINAGRAIANGSNGAFNVALNGLTIRNNIIKNVARYGLMLFLEGQAANVAMSNVLATQNLFDNVRSYGVYAENNGYVSVVDNKMTHMRSGVGVFTIGTQYAGTGTPQITGNDIETEGTGLYYNNFAGFGPPAVGTGTPFNVANNTFRSLGSTNTAVRGYSLNNSGHTFTNNTITSGAATGFDVWNVPGGLTITGGSVDGATGRAVRESNFNATFGNSSATNLLTVSGLAITNSPLGIQVQDSPSNTNSASTSAVITGNTQITGSVTFTAVAISGSDASASITGNASSFVGNGSGVGVDVNGGTASVTANRITNFVTGINVSNGGQLTSAANNFITGNTDGIVYAADAGTTQGVVTINDLSGNTDKAIINGLASTTINASCNYFGAPNATTNPTYVTGNVLTTQVLANNTDEDTSAPGFQNTSCFTPPVAPVLTATPPANPQGGSYNASYCIGENPTVTSNYTTGVNSFTVQSLSDGSTTVTTGNSVTINQGAGTYFVYATNTQNGYTSPVSATTTIQVQPNVTSFTSSKVAYCVGETVSLTALGCNVAASPQSPLYFVRLRALDGSNNPNQGTVNLAYGVDSYTYTPSFAPTTTTSYTITAECVNGGTGSVCSVRELTLTANPVPTATLVSSNSLNCSVTSTTLTATGGQTYAFAGPGLVSQDPTSGTAVANVGGQYSVTVTSAGGCTSMTTTTIASDTAVPTVTLAASGPITCAQTSVTLTANTGTRTDTYAFAGPGGAIPSTRNTAMVSAAGTYTVTATSTNGCSSTATTTVISDTAVPAASLVVSGSITCSSPTATLTANPATRSGTDTYAFTGPSGPISSTGNTATVMAAGTYSVTVTSANGCLSTATTSVTSDTAVTSLTLTSSNNLSCGVTSATLTASPDPTVRSAYTYVFSPGATQIGASNQATVTTGGPYSVTATSVGNGCSVSATTTVTSSTAAPTVSLMSSGTISCASPSVTLTASTNARSDTYAFAGPNGPIPSTRNTAVVSSGGVYSVTATSTNGCTSTTTTRVASDTAIPSATLVVSGAITCTSPTATLTANPATRSGTDTYAFSGPTGPVSSTGNTATVSSAGDYTVVVTSTNGCSASATTTVTSDTAVTSLTLASSNNLSCGVTSATLTASLDPAVRSNSYSYAFSSGATQIGASNQATVSTGGVYSVTATSVSNGCSVTATTNVTSSTAAPTVSLVASGTISCASPSVTLTASTNARSDTYAFSGPNGPIPSTRNTAVVSTGGVYSVTATSTNGCFSTTTTTVASDTAVPSATLVVSGAITCSSPTATLTANPATRSGTDTYAFSGPSGPVSSTGNTATVMAAGTYSVTVTSANGCLSTATTSVVSDTAVTSLTLTSSNNLSCGVTSATLTASLDPAVRVTSYSYAFSSGATQIGTSNQATITTAGLYSVTATSVSNGCSVSATTTVTSSTVAPTVSLVASGTISCASPSVTLTASTNARSDTYAFSGPNGPIPSTRNTAVVSSGGVYSVTVTSTNGCTSTTTTNVASDTAVPSATLVNNGPLTCAQTSVTLTATGGGTYAFSGPGLSQTGMNNTAVATQAGTYSVIVTSANGCSVLATTTVTSSTGIVGVTLTSSNGLSCGQTSSTLTANLDPTGARTTYTYAFSNGASQIGTSNQATVTTAGPYSVTVTAANGCTVTAATSVTADTTIPTATLTSSNSLNCAVTSATLTANASGGSGFTYAFSAGASQIGTSNQATITTGGPYSVTVTSVNGCSAVSTTSVASDTTTPTATLMSSGALSCSVTSVTLTASGGQTYTFTGPNFNQTGVSNTAVATQAGNYSVVVTAANGCSAVTTIPVDQSTTVVTPDFATRGNQGIPDGLTSVTVIQNSSSVSFAATNCAGTLNWSGNGQMGITTLNAPTSATGVFIYQATCTVGNCVSNPTSVTLTVNPVPVTTNLTVLSRDPENGNLNTNTIKPYLLLQNDGSTPIPYGELTVRYYLTVENNVPLRFDINYAQMGNDKVHLQYVPLNPARQGAGGYIEFSFDASAGSLAPMSNAVIQDLVNKQDYSMFFQGDDYSYVNNANFTPNPHITAYRNGVLIYGVEPVPTGPPAPLMLTASANPTTLLTTASTQLQANASGGTPSYTYTFSGPGSIQPNGNTATVSGLSAGVQTFTVTARDATSPVNQTIATTVSVTVTAPANQAPVATANSNQTATQGVPFSYTANAFTDDTPNSLTYTAQINPANGFTFNPATRVIQGTPTSTGVSSVTITATDPGGLSASTVFTITVNAQPVAPTALTLTASASPTTILTTGSTQLQANVSGGTPGYTYTFSGPGTIQSNGNTATVSGLPAGVQTFTVTARDATSPVNQTIATTVSVTVNAPANQAPVATANANQTATQGMPFSYTANAFTDDTPNSLTYTASIDPANGFTFNPATRVIQGTPTSTGVSSVTITATDPGGLSASTVFTITVNATAVTPTTNLTVYSRDPDNGQLNTNTLKPYLQFQNDGNTPIPYGELTVRYWLTVENPAPLIYQINYAQLGSDKVHLNYVSQPRQGASGYIEFSFDASAGSLAPMSNSGPIQDLINKQDYSYFFQGDDYSYVNNGNFTPNPHITAYRNGVLVYGVEPPSAVRMAAENADASLRIEVLGNPLVGGELAVKVRGAAGQSLRLRVTDLNGHLVNERTVERAGTVEEQRIPVSQQAAGLLFLQVSTPSQTLTVKVLKAD